MTKEELERIKGLSVGLALQPKWWALITALESAWADLELRDVALLKIRKAMGLERDSEEDLVDRAQALLLLIEQAAAKRDELIYNLTLEELKHDKTRQLSEVHRNDRIRAEAECDKYRMEVKQLTNVLELKEELLGKVALLELMWDGEGRLHE